MQSRLAGPILILLSALCFSVTGTLQALAPAGATPWVIAEVRMVTSAFFLFCGALRPGNFRNSQRTFPGAPSLSAPAARVCISSSSFSER